MSIHVSKSKQNISFLYYYVTFLSFILITLKSVYKSLRIKNKFPNKKYCSEYKVLIDTLKNKFNLK